MVGPTMDDDAIYQNRNTKCWRIPVILEFVKRHFHGYCVESPAAFLSPTFFLMLGAMPFLWGKVMEIFHFTSTVWVIREFRFAFGWKLQMLKFRNATDLDYLFHSCCIFYLRILSIPISINLYFIVTRIYYWTYSFICIMIYGLTLVIVNMRLTFRVYNERPNFYGWQLIRARFF